MTAIEFLKNKGLINPDQSQCIIFFGADKESIDLVLLLKEYHALASGQKIDVNKKFVNLTEKYEKEKTST